MSSPKQRKRKRLFDEQGGKCYWCGCQMRDIRTAEMPLPPDACTLDHIFTRADPRRYGTWGHDAPKSYVAACQECNVKRGNRMFETYRRRVA